MRWIISAAVILAVVSCGQRRDDVFHPRPFPAATVPSMMTDVSEAASYLAGHFWDEFTDTSKMYPCDSSVVNGVRKEEVEQAYANYAALLDMVPQDEAVESVRDLFGKISAVEMKDSSSNVFETLVEITERYLYDPNSPFRNEDYYLPFVEGLSRSAFVPESRKPGYAYDAGMCALNRVGTAAADFIFADSRGRRHTLYGIDADYTVLFFSNPGCAACKDIIDALDSSPKIGAMISEGRLAVLNIYIDTDLDEWRRYMPVYPDTWYNGYDPEFVIRTDVLYNVRAIPSLYLLDSRKTVLMKDAPQERLFRMLESL